LVAFHHIADADERGVHDRFLASETMRLIESRQARVSDISRIAFVTGPGSFTGLRIGLAFAKGLAFAGAARLAPVIAHVALKDATQQTAAGIVTPGYEPRSVYYASFDAPGEVTLRPIAEVSGPLLGPASLQKSFEERGVGYIVQSLELSANARCGMNAEPVENLADLEPFYGTDFKPHPGAAKG
jgi:tRNA threonylcarbamoyl adenosine modification protein YeaZ